jgi:hypothetical protein
MTLMGEPLDDDDLPRFGLDVRNAVLNHRDTNDVGNRHYNAALKDARWLYKPRKAAGAYWSGWLDRLKAEALAP